MGRTLKLSFAMGGGVSLGTFSGAALTETLKLFILFGRDEEGNHYDEIVLDSFSGASAGAISLSILMRCLLDYKSMMGKVEKTEDDIIGELKEQYGKEVIKRCTEKGKIEMLMAAEVAQQIQYRIWVEEAEIVSLFEGVEGRAPVTAKNFSLLRKDLMLDLSTKYLIQDCENIQLVNKQILADHVLFACSLTNLLGRELLEESKGRNAAKRVENEALYREYLKATISFEHKELRVIEFDLNEKANTKDSKKIDDQPSVNNWIKVVANSSEDKGTHNFDSFLDKQVFPLYSAECWAMFASSAIACGSFPLAFEPAILQRNASEFPPFNKREDYLIKYPYIDGGTFNNEPIKEAFRLANFIDLKSSIEKKQSDPEDRLIIFVDPFVEPIDYRDVRIASYDELFIKKRKSGLLKSLVPGTELSKAADLIGTLIGALHDQGSIKEESKSQNYLQHVRLKKALRNYFVKININLENEELDDLIVSTINKIRKDLQLSYIPPGTRDVGEFFRIHFSKTIIEEEQQVTKSRVLQFFGKERKDLPNDILGTVKEIFEAYDEKEKSTETDSILRRSSNRREKTFFEELKDHGITNDEQQVKIVKTILNMLSDVALDTYGKDEGAIRMAITPVSYNHKDAKVLQTIFLPGSEIQAFAGFSSEISRKIAFEYGRYCSAKSLQRADFRCSHNRQLNRLDLDVLSTKAFIAPEESASIISRLEKNINNLFGDSGGRFNSSIFAKDINKNTVRLIRNRILRIFYSVLFSKLPYLFFGLLLIIFINNRLLTLFQANGSSSVVFPVIIAITTVIICTVLLGGISYVWFQSVLKKKVVDDQIQKNHNSEITLILRLQKKTTVGRKILLETIDKNRNKTIKAKKKLKENHLELFFKLCIENPSDFDTKKYFSLIKTSNRKILNPLRYFDRNNLSKIDEALRINSIRLSNGKKIPLDIEHIEKLGTPNLPYLYPVLIWSEVSSENGAIVSQWQLHDAVVSLEEELLEYYAEYYI